MSTPITSTVEVFAKPRWTRTLHRPETLADDLGPIGVSVGPRSGPNKRNPGDKEDYVLRRFLAAEKQRDRLHLPAELHAAPKDGQPREADFVIVRDGESIGIEITEAGDEDYQSWLTRIESVTAPGGIVHVPSSGSVGKTVVDLVDAIERKVRKYDKGWYRSTPRTHLVIYDDTAWGDFQDKGRLVSGVRDRNDLTGRFEQVHIVFQSLVVLDLFETPDFVDISNLYESDYGRWIEDQADRLRRGEIDGLDLFNIAGEIEDLGRSERRALASHIRNLMLHLLKYEVQPEFRTSSWEATIANARAEIEDALTENPSFRRELPRYVAEQYKRARRQASRETGIAIEALPVECPYQLKQLVDDDFFPAHREH
jgi:hypothetical protein